MQYPRRIPAYLCWFHANCFRSLSASLAEERKKEEEQNHVLAGCRFPILALLTGDLGGLVCNQKG